MRDTVINIWQCSIIHFGLKKLQLIKHMCVSIDMPNMAWDIMTLYIYK